MKYIIHILLVLSLVGCVTTGDYKYYSVEVYNLYDKGTFSYLSLQSDNMGIVGLMGSSSYEKNKFDELLFDDLNEIYGSSNVKSRKEILEKLGVEKLEYFRGYREHSINFENVKKTDFSKLKDNTRYLLFFDILEDKITESDYEKDLGHSVDVCFKKERSLTIAFHIYDTYAFQPVWGGDFTSSDDNQRCSSRTKKDKPKSTDEAMGSLLTAFFDLAVFTATYEPIPAPSKVDIMKRIFQKFILKIPPTSRSKAI